MLELEIDGVKIEMPEGSMVMDAVKKMGKYVPHFCYHEKLISGGIVSYVFGRS
jgi:NADH-quinone oxidoreductase subunit G